MIWRVVFINKMSIPGNLVINFVHLDCTLWHTAFVHNLVSFFKFDYFIFCIIFQILVFETKKLLYLYSLLWSISIRNYVSSEGFYLLNDLTFSHRIKQCCNLTNAIIVSNVVLVLTINSDNKLSKYKKKDTAV